MIETYLEWWRWWVLTGGPMTLLVLALVGLPSAALYSLASWALRRLDAADILDDPMRSFGVSPRPPTDSTDRGQGGPDAKQRRQ